MYHYNYALLSGGLSPNIKVNKSSDHKMAPVSCSTQRSINFVLLINVKMPKIIDILTFISRIDTTSEILMRKNRYFQHLIY